MPVCGGDLSWWGSLFPPEIRPACVRWWFILMFIIPQRSDLPVCGSDLSWWCSLFPQRLDLPVCGGDLSWWCSLFSQRSDLCVRWWFLLMMFIVSPEIRPACVWWWFLLMMFIVSPGDQTCLCVVVIHPDDVHCFPWRLDLPVHCGDSSWWCSLFPQRSDLPVHGGDSSWWCSLFPQRSDLVQKQLVFQVQLLSWLFSTLDTEKEPRDDPSEPAQPPQPKSPKPVSCFHHLLMSWSSHCKWCFGDCWVVFFQAMTLKVGGVVNKGMFSQSVIFVVWY